MILAIIVMLYITGKSLYISYEMQMENQRLIRNDVNMNAQLTYYFDKLGREAAKTPVLEYKQKELYKIFPEVKQKVTDLKIKPKRVESYSEVTVTSGKEITVPAKDSTTKKNDSIIPGKYFAYADNWYNVQGWIIQDTMNLKISSTDTIIQVVSRGGRLNPWLWIFSRRQLTQTI
ncbi:hypothetical protein JZU46_01185, partial [bacterium]|nr:hypothetical protein [bacterium]